MGDEQGFSLVELLIVVAIIAIIAAIAVPSLLTSRMAANEAAAIQGCRTLGSAEIAHGASDNQRYAPMANLVTGQYIDTRWVVGNNISGYVYSENHPITPPGVAVAVGGATPLLFGFLATHQSGASRWDYEIGVDQVVRWGPTLPPNLLPQPVQHDPLGK
jgi:prepilin-type N-terminal cleavage/methylation domain-containing protein